MADRYWVGGTASWDGAAGTKWSTTSGGAGGASVPTTADDVFFTNLSTGTCTIATGNTGAKSINCTGFAGTLAGTASITVAGSITLAAGMTYTYTGQLTITGTGTITSAAKSFNGSVIIDGVGITVTLGDAWTLGGGSGTLTLTRGTLTTNNYNLTALDFNSANTNTRTLNLGSSTVTLTFNGWNTSTNTNFTLNAGTSTVIIANTGGGNLQAGPTNDSTAPGLTFYNVSFVGFTFGGTRGINGKNTFNNLTLAGAVFAGFVAYNLTASQTINGTFSTTSVAGNRRVICRTNSLGIAHTLTVNASPSLTDIDFRDIYVIGTAAPISGTRIGDLRGCRGITFSTPKTVYWSNNSGGSWSSTSWATSAGGVASDANFPLAQDTATFVNTGLNTSATVTMDISVPYTGTVDMSGRTNAMTLSVGAYTIYGDWKNGSGTTLSGANMLTYSGRNTQTITSAGKTFSGPLTVDSYGGSVELADALNIGSNTLTVTNGTFDTKNFNVTAGSLSSSNSNVRTITLGSSTVTLDQFFAIAFSTITNLTLNAGTSTINISASTPVVAVGAPGVTFYNVAFTSTAAGDRSFNGAGINTINNLTVNATAAVGVLPFFCAANQTITGTLTVSGASPVRRIFVRSDTLGTQRTLSVGTLSATDCDFRDIAITGTAAGASPTRAGDCGGNSGITFPAGKTVYWNLAGAQNWSATGWASSSGGTPDINNFPLAQDTAVFDNTGSVTGTITIDQAWNIGTFDASLRTSAMTLTTGSNAPFVYGDWKFGTGVTSSSTTGTITFAKRGTQTITSNGVSFNCPVTVDSVNGTTQLADALSLTSSRNFVLRSGTFDAISYNLTCNTVNFTATTDARTLKMGSGTWTLSGTSTVWDASNTTNLAFYKGTANIVLSDTSTTARTFAGGGLSYNKLTIGGTTGTSTTTITGNNQFTELASTKTVAHTIALGSTTQTFGKWTVTGTAGNVVTLTGTGPSHILAGACTSGIDYLAMGSIGFAATSPGEFYAGANSTGTAAAPVYRTAKPADSTRYWVGGTGNWSSTTKWSTSSGGASGASVPRSHDDVVFDAASNATSYTATIDAVTGGVRMKKLTIAGPASGSLTLAGSALTFVHDNISFPASGFIFTYSGSMTLTGSTTGRTLTTNGIAHSFPIAVNGVDCGWAFGSAATPSGIIVTNGSLDFAGYAVTTASLATNNTNTCTVNFGSGTTTISGTSPINFGTTENTRANLTVIASTSQINVSSNSPTFSGNNQTFYNVSFTGVSTGTITVNGDNSYNNLSFSGNTSAGLKSISLAANQTVAGTLTFSAGTNATMRRFARSNTLGTTRTITAAAVSMTDVDFRDITIAGAATPASGTRIGDCKGNSGITFDAPKTVYWATAGGQWGANNWSASIGGAVDITQFPLAQDTVVFPSAYPNSGQTVTIDAAYNIGTIDMSARTTNTMTLATGTTTPFIHGNWINGTGTTITGTGTLTFAGRGSQTITSAGKTFTQNFTVNTPSGSVTLQDAFTNSVASGNGLDLQSGTFDASTFNVTFSGTSAVALGNSTTARTCAFGSGTWTIAGNTFSANPPTNLTVTGTGTISLTSASAKTFAGGGVAYTNITLNQGGNGTLTITGNNTFKTISSTAAGANTISLGTTTQRITTSWTAAGTAGNVLTVTGSSATSPGTLVFTGSGQAANVDYLTVTGVRAYSLTDTWYAGGNSTNNGSLGWIFAAAGGTIYNVSFSDTATGADAISATATFNVSFSDTATGLDAVSGGSVFSADFSDSATGTDAIAASVVISAAFSDTATGADALNTSAVLNVAISDTATGTDTLNTTATLNVAFSDTATGADAINVNATLSAAFSDTAAGADAVSTTATLNVSVSDTASGLDAVSAGLVFSAAFADTASAADSINAGGTFNVAFSDTASGADAISATATLIAAFSDAASILDDPAVAASIFNVTLDEVASGLDILSPAGSTFNVSLSESGTLVDLVAGDYLWNPIDDSQSPNWQNVVATQAPGWTDVNTTQSPGWQNVVTAPTTTWTDIDDSQSPGWVQIQT